MTQKKIKQNQKNDFTAAWELNYVKAWIAMQQNNGKSTIYQSVKEITSQ